MVYKLDGYIDNLAMKIPKLDEVIDRQTPDINQIDRYIR